MIQNMIAVWWTPNNKRWSKNQIEPNIIKAKISKRGGGYKKAKQEIIHGSRKLTQRKWLNRPEDNQKLVKHKKKSENVAATEKKIIMMMMGWAGQANSKQQLSIDHNFNNISDDQLAPSFFCSFMRSNQFSRRFITLFLLYSHRVNDQPNDRSKSISHNWFHKTIALK